MATIFSKIISGEIQAHKIAEDKNFLAFLDLNPLARGHTLVIPKKEIDYIFDIEDKELSALWVFAKAVAKRIESKIECQRIGVAVIGLEVAHAHIHLIPLNSVSDINFSKPKLKLSNKELAEIAIQLTK